MYVGNGVTKKFPIPNGKDGSVVILKLPNGHGYKMTLNEAYYIQDGNIIFNSAIPPGIEISFDISDATQIITASSNNYTIIRSDGTIEEVSEDPTLIIEEARNLLAEARKTASNTAAAYQAAKEFITNKTKEAENYLTNKTLEYSGLVEDKIYTAKIEAREALISEWQSSLQIIKNESKAVREDLEAIQEVKYQIRAISDTAVSDFDKLIQEKGASIIEDCEAVKKIRPELDIYKLEAKKELKDEAFNITEVLRIKLNEELQLLRDLRKQVEDNFNTLNTKINNRWEMFTTRY